MNSSQSSFPFSHSIVTTDSEWRSLPPEVASADISIARTSFFLANPTVSSSLSADGSFVETSSGPAARELKRRYDQYLGVNKDVRSPYAITAFINQHGRQMYRVR
jgi:GDP/GTP exchange factor required for growth at low temperature